jgi:hypothetical protein
LPIHSSTALKAGYKGFEAWFKSKAEEEPYVVDDGHRLSGMIYLKEEDGPVSDVAPPLPSKRWLKVGTLKIEGRGTKLGERVLKKILDTAIEENRNGIYVTVFELHAELIRLFQRYGFKRYAVNHSSTPCHDDQTDIQRPVTATSKDKPVEARGEKRLRSDALPLEHVDHGQGVFLIGQLKGLLRGLAHESFREQETQGPSIRGKVNWPATLVARSAGRLGEGRFLVRRSAKSFDLPENQLLRLLLATTVSDRERMRAVIGTGALYSEFAKMRRMAGAGLRDYNLRSVSKELRINIEMIQCAHAHRNPAYREAARLLRRRQIVTESIQTGRLEAVLSMVRSGGLRLSTKTICSSCMRSP